jgi:hypothetical protein
MAFYSKQLKHYRSTFALFVAHSNLYRVPCTHKQTPAHAAGLTDLPWITHELLAGCKNMKMC